MPTPINRIARAKTPLCWAVENGYEGVVKMPLGWDDVGPNKPNEGGC